MVMMKEFCKKLCYLIIVFFIGNILIDIFNNNTATKMIYYTIGYCACIIYNFEMIFKGEK